MVSEKCALALPLFAKTPFATAAKTPVARFALALPKPGVPVGVSLRHWPEVSAATGLGGANVLQALTKTDARAVPASTNDAVATEMMEIARCIAPSLKGPSVPVKCVVR